MMKTIDRSWPLRPMLAAIALAPAQARRTSSRSASSRRCRVRPRCSASSSATASSSRSRTLGGKLGGREVELLRRRTTSSSPTSPSPRSRRFIERDKVDFVVGPVFSNILRRIIKPVTEGGAFLISPNAGTSNFAGKECNPNLFVTSYQNDQNHEVLGKYAQDQGHQEGLHHGAELSGRQGRARRLQALLQGRGRRRSLCAAQPARLLGRALQDRRGQRRTRSSCSCRAAWA